MLGWFCCLPQWNILINQSSHLSRANVNLMGTKGDHFHCWLQPASLSIVKGSFFAISGFGASQKSRRGYSLLSSLINTGILKLDMFISGCTSIFCSHIKPGNCCLANIAERSCTFETEMWRSCQPSLFLSVVLTQRFKTGFPGKVLNVHAVLFPCWSCGQSKARGI